MKFIKCVFGLSILAVLIYIYSLNSNDELSNSILDKADSKYVSYLESSHKDKEIIAFDSKDVTNDNIEDLILIYKKNNETKFMVLIKEDKKYTQTQSLKAPKENQKITFRDIDSKDQMEIIVAGSKNGNYGYAIYRVQNNELVNLFGEDMEDCC